MASPCVGFLAKFAAVLDGLPPGSDVALVTMTGSCCPVTLAHVMAFEKARDLLLGELADHPRPKRMEHFQEVLGLLSLNSDRHVSSKMSEKGDKAISFADRATLVQLASAELPWMDFNDMREHLAAQALQERWPNLKIVRYSMNGADDVLKYEKWNGCSESKRAIAMGRPGFTDKVRTKATRAKADSQNGYFILGPELPDISSSRVRSALKSGDLEELGQLLHPEVVRWCLSQGPYKIAGGSGAGAKPASSAEAVPGKPASAETEGGKPICQVT
eukprot:gb/GFBE01066712.1/.p1 GENE.gb/GFBE01066712.1/~~gb/GFBE01066712.1/.p1  ORF type:complete len:274 (+),score=50.08 gb/GFBE01066712.1/:1-822(+)